jgi:hypothetical protein
MAQLPRPAHGFHPPEDLFNQLSFLLADGVSRVTRRATVDGGADGFLRDMRGDLQRSHGGDEGADIEVLVAPDRAARRSTGGGWSALSR